MISTPSWGIARQVSLSALLGEPVAWRPLHPEGRAVVGWGRKPSFFRALRQGRATGLPVWALEDGFLRSVGFGRDEPTLSLIVDDVGIYYDARRPSRLEALLSSGTPDAQVLDRGRDLIRRWRAARVSKYNHAPNPQAPLPETFVLVIDQTFGDASVDGGLADAASFGRMLDAALAEHPDDLVVLKVHPEVMAGRKRGYFDLDTLGGHPRLRVLGDDVHPVPLIERAKAIYTVTSQVGFEGLLWGRPVRVFGMPFYAGWGLTEDDLPRPERRRPVSLEHLVHAALVDYPRYVDPETGMRCEPERVIEHLGLQRDLRARWPTTAWAVGFSWWKRRCLPAFMHGCALRFVASWSAVPEGAVAVCWANRPVPAGRTALRVEDGFIRSVGLGADLVRPVSWVIDDEGIYYDATRPSRLERILAETVFDEALLHRAAALRQEICKLALTKYNVGGAAWRRPAGARRVILVPGQVESDASIRYGAPGVNTNMGLLQAVRTANPQAWVVYKPHPDVIAGLRKAGQGEDEARRWCDEIVLDAPMGQLLDAVDEVHVMTSLTGFEALLRGQRVVCYGLPFYAGWGVTEGVLRCERRTRRLSLDELVAGALILYPTYVSRVSGRFTTPENVLRELAEWREQTPVSMSFWRRVLRWTLQWRAN